MTEAVPQHKGSMVNPDHKTTSPLRLRINDVKPQIGHQLHKEMFDS